MLEWEGPDENGIWRAYDDYAMYTISQVDGEESCKVGYLTSPGQIFEWRSGFSSLDEAKASAEHCVEHVHKIRSEPGRSEAFVKVVESQSSEMNSGKIEEFEFPGESEGFREIKREISSCGRIVMVVGVRPDDNYTYALYCWDLSESEYTGSGSWVPCAVGGMFSDIGAAIDEAKQALISRSTSDEI